MHKGILSRISFIHIYTGLGLIIIALLIVFKKRKKLSNFNLYLLFSFCGILLSIFYSYYTTVIDDNIRIKSNAFLYLEMIIVFNIPRHVLNSLKVFVLLILGLNSFTLITHYKNTAHLLEKYDTFIKDCDQKRVHILYKNFKNKKERNDAAVLFFKMRLIDKGFQIDESESPASSDSGCRINTSEIIRMNH
ncbi:glucose dehydrogenase [Chryseobacterium sp. SORGH_AS 1048]|nr:glucose dehydrogenase [Chryseobacterium sp. SORGH_AS_1048]